MALSSGLPPREMGDHSREGRGGEGRGGEGRGGEGRGGEGRGGDESSGTLTESVFLLLQVVSPLVLGLHTHTLHTQVITHINSLASAPRVPGAHRVRSHSVCPVWPYWQWSIAL